MAGDTRTAAKPGRLRAAISYESGIWRSLFRWSFRRPPRMEPGDEAFAYAAGVAPLIWVFIGISAVEIPILHLLLPSTTLRLIALALGAWGLLWMLGMLASMYEKPHIIGRSGVRIRYGLSVDYEISWDRIAEIRYHKRTLVKSRTVQLEDSTLHIAVNTQTNVEIVLLEPMTLPVPKVGDCPVSTIRCYADDQGAMISSARAHLAAIGDQP